MGGSILFVNAGSIVASILILAATYGFSFYLSRFSSYNKLYGSIGTMIALMIWLYLLAFVIILGFEINASITAARSRELQKSCKAVICRIITFSASPFCCW
jgi:membrane protein